MSRPTQVLLSYRPSCPYGNVTLSVRPFQTVPVPWTVSYEKPYYPGCASTQTVWAPPLSLATTPGTEMFQFPGFAHLYGVTGLQPAGLPHSDTRGSVHACRSPRIFAACRVLHRFRKPRHPPSAISNFFCESNDFRLAFVKLYLKRPISYASCFNLVRFSLIIVNELPPSRARAPYVSKTEETIYKCHIKSESGCRSAPKRRCSSHTFRYGYLVTT